MYRLIFILLLSIFSTSLCAQKSNLKAYVDLKEFYHPEIGNYIEVQLQFATHSTSLKTVGDTSFQASLAIFLDVFSEDSIIKSDAYVLNSPLYAIKDSLIEDFYEIKRFALEPGKYKLKIEIRDINSTEERKISGTEPFQIHKMSDAVSISDLVIAEYAFISETESIFQKSGFHIIPMLFNFFSTESNKIPFYYEVYNSHLVEDTIIGVMHKIINTENDEELEEFTTLNRFSTGELFPNFKVIDIEFLASGSYLLELSVVDRKLNVLSSRSYAFERNNEVLSVINSDNVILNPAFQESIPNDSIFYYLESLIPISRPAETKNIVATLKTKNIEKCRKHLQAFWIRTANVDSYEDWLKYKNQVDFVEKVYANNFQEGFETDRGRVYLKYGAPSNIITRETSPSEYPYEIWTYNKIGVFSNKRFVFYNPDLVNKAYRLLHSDMVGELKNNAWPQILSKRNTVNGNVDNPNQNIMDHWGGNSNDYFRQY